MRRVDATEQRVCDEIGRREDDLVELLRDLVRFDTTSHTLGAHPRDEVALQGLLAARLRAAGATVDVWEPDVGALAGHPMMPDGLLVRRPAAAGGALRRRRRRTHPAAQRPRRCRLRRAARPLAHIRRSGRRRRRRVHGRGACDMKGGVACMVLAAELLASLGVRLPAT